MTKKYEVHCNYDQCMNVEERDQPASFCCKCSGTSLRNIELTEQARIQKELAEEKEGELK